MIPNYASKFISHAALGGVDATDLPGVRQDYTELKIFSASCGVVSATTDKL
ncbi:hypothetical protein GCM10028791_11810 [Echinicola sediminis]